MPVLLKRKEIQKYQKKILKKGEFLLSISYQNTLRKLFRVMRWRLHKRAIHFYIFSLYKNMLHRTLIFLSMQVKIVCVAILNRGSKSQWANAPEWVITLFISRRKLTEKDMVISGMVYSEKSAWRGYAASSVERNLREDSLV